MKVAVTLRLGLISGLGMGGGGRKVFVRVGGRRFQKTRTKLITTMFFQPFGKLRMSTESVPRNCSKTNIL